MITVASSRPTFSSSSSSAAGAAAGALEAPKPVEVLAPKLNGLTEELVAVAAEVDEDPRLPNEKPPVDAVVVVGAEEVDSPKEVDGEAPKEKAGVTFSAASGLDAPNEKPPVVVGLVASSFLVPKEKPPVVAAGLSTSSFLVPNEKPPLEEVAGLAPSLLAPNERPLFVATDFNSAFFLSSLLIAPKENPDAEAVLFAGPFVGVTAVVTENEGVEVANDDVAARAGCC